MRRYETIFIADPDLPQESRTSLFEKTENLISANQGVLIDFDEWGNRRLAYDVKKKLRGHYVRLDYCGLGETITSLENAFRIDERIMKFMTIAIGELDNPQELKEEVAAKKEAIRESQAAAAEEAAAKAEAAEAAAKIAAEAAAKAAAEEAPAESAKTEEAPPADTEPATKEEASPESTEAPQSDEEQ